jgi:RNA polymerase sigma-70 factor (ECF subfamily)
MKKTKLVSDATLVVSYQAGDKSALQLLVKRWHLKFCKFAFWIVKDADVAKDIAQESWAAIMIKIHDLKDPKKFKSWAISIVNRKAIDWIRTKNSENNKLVKFYNENPKVQESNEFEDNQKLKLLILKSINALSNEHQTVVKLFYTESYTLKEISEILKISIGTTKSRLFHAKEKLKTILKNKKYGN